MNGFVLTMMPFQGELIVGGAQYMTPFGPVARWDGKAWQPLNGGHVYGAIRVLANYGGDVVAAGSTVGISENLHGPETVFSKSIARWDGEQWHGFGGGLAGHVHALVEYKGDLIAGGSFQTTSTFWQEDAAIPLNFIARWDGEQWHSLGGGFNGPVRSLIVHNGELIVGGAFTMAGVLDDGPTVSVNSMARWDGQQWHAMGAGVAGGGVWALAEYMNADGEIEVVAGGTFTSAGGIAVNRIARWNGTEWLPLGEGVSGGVADFTGFGPGVSALIAYGSDLIVGGKFAVADGVPANNIARWNGMHWEAMGSGTHSSSNPYGTVYALVGFQGDVILGGEFADWMANSGEGIVGNN